MSPAPQIILVVFFSGFVVGTDGMRSSVRQCLLETEGVRMEALGSTDDMVNVGFTSQELGTLLKEQNPGMLHMVLNGKVKSKLYNEHNSFITM